MQRIAELQREGLWSEKRLPKVAEPPRAKSHWDYLLEEMVWLAADFAQERKWKKSSARKVRPDFVIGKGFFALQLFFFFSVEEWFLSISKIRLLLLPKLKEKKSRSCAKLLHLLPKKYERFGQMLKRYYCYTTRS